MKVFLGEEESGYIESIEIKKVDDAYKLYVNGREPCEPKDYHLVFHSQYPYVYAEVVRDGDDEKGPLSYTWEEMFDEAYRRSEIIIARKMKEAEMKMEEEKLCRKSTLISVASLIVVFATFVVTILRLCLGA